MNRTASVKVIGRTLQDVTASWGQIQPFCGGADLIVSNDPIERGLEGPSEPEGFVFAIAETAADLDRLRELDVAPDWLFVLSPARVMQVSLAVDHLAVAVIPLEHADMALSRIGLTKQHRAPSARKFS